MRLRNNWKGLLVPEVNSRLDIRDTVLDGRQQKFAEVLGEYRPKTGQALQSSE
jgi:hypothetical protein